MQATAVKTTWAIDPAHSELTFKVKHLMITNVKGAFRKFSGTIESDGNDFSDAKVKAIIDASSIFTNDESRDSHLKSADFFDTTLYPELSFEGSTFKKLDDANYQLKGMLTIKNISRMVTFDVDYGGMSKDPWGNQK